MRRSIYGALLLLPLLVSPLMAEENAARTLRFVQDDAQDYMVSKIYTLKYVQANDMTPFVMGIVM